MHFIFNSRAYKKYSKIISINIAAKNLIKQNIRTFFCVFIIIFKLVRMYIFFYHQMIKLTFCIFVLEIQSFFFKTSVFLHKKDVDDNQTSDDDRGDDTNNNRRNVQGVIFIDNTFFRSTSNNYQIENEKSMYRL